MKLGIIGSSGFIGRHLISYFQSAVPIGRRDVDLLDPEAVKDYFGRSKFDVIIHCAVIGGGRMCDENPNILDSNLRMFFNVREATSARIIYLSSGAALRGAPPLDPYGFSKYIIEKCSDVQIVRIWGCFGPDEPETRFFATAKREGHVNIHKDCRFDFCHVDDLCRIVEHAYSLISIFKEVVTFYMYESRHYRNGQHWHGFTGKIAPGQFRACYCVCRSPATYETNSRGGQLFPKGY